MSEPMKDWLSSGRYLPAPLRDFHDQKDAFKAIHETTAVEKHSYAGKVDWVTGQCYVIDIFLWWMAKRGYTLQKTRKRLAFRDLESDIEAAKNERDAHFSAALMASLSPLPTPPTEPVE